MKQILTVLFTSLFLFGCNAQKSNVLSTTEFDKAIKNKNIQLLDVRTKEEYQQGHIANSLQANWNDDAEFLKRSEALSTTKPVYVYCLAGGRSSAAAENLRKRGYAVYELKGGISGWKNAKLPTEGISSLEKGMTLDMFSNFINTNEMVLVDFGATWCPPCIKMNPVLDSLTMQIPGIKLLKIDLDKDKEICNHFGVTQIPIFHSYKKGKKVNEDSGIVSLEDLKRMFN